MPVSHIGLTVSHLPTSCSFFLAALSPLKYKYFGQQNNQIGFGVDSADFFICQDSPGMRPGAAHVAFEAPSKQAVDDFFHAALKAGARIHGEPTYRESQSDTYNAAVIDFDDNAIEVVYRDRQAVQTSGSAAEEDEGSHVLKWRKEVARSTVNTSRRDATSQEPGVKESSPQERTHPLRTIVNHFITAPAFAPSPPSDLRASSDSSKALIGTLLGAAAGAAIAYAMTKGESQSPLTPPTTPQRQIYQIEAPRISPRSVTYTSYPHAPTEAPSQRSHSFSQPRSRPLAIEASPYTTGTLISTFIPSSEAPRPMVPLPASARSSYSHTTVRDPLPDGRSHFSPQSSTSRRSHHSPPPTASSPTSHHHNHGLPATPGSSTSRHSQRPTSRSTHSIPSTTPSCTPLPASSAASSTTVTPRSKPRSVAPSTTPSRTPLPISNVASDVASAVTVTRRSMAPGELSRPKTRSTVLNDGIDDAASLAPSDSVSQIGSRGSRSRRGESELGDGVKETGKKKGGRRRKEKSGKGEGSFVTAPVGGVEKEGRRRSVVSFY